MSRSSSSLILSLAALLATAGAAEAQRFAFVARTYLPETMEQRSRVVLFRVSRHHKAPITESELKVAIPATLREHGYAVSDTVHDRIRRPGDHGVVMYLEVRANGVVSLSGTLHCDAFSSAAPSFSRPVATPIRQRLSAGELVPLLRRTIEEIDRMPSCGDLRFSAALRREPRDTASINRGREADARRRAAERAPVQPVGPANTGSEPPRKPPLKDN